MEHVVEMVLALSVIGLLAKFVFRNKFVNDIIPFVFLLVITGIMTSCSSSDGAPEATIQNASTHAPSRNIDVEETVDTVSESQQEDEDSKTIEEVKEELEEEFENEDPTQKNEDAADEEEEVPAEEVNEDASNDHILVKKGDIILNCTDRSGLASKFHDDYGEGTLSYTPTSNGVIVRAKMYVSGITFKTYRVPNIRSYLSLRKSNPTIKRECRKKIAHREAYLYRR